MSVCPSVRQNRATCLVLDGFSWTLFEDIPKICWQSLSLITIWQEQRGTLHEDLCKFVIVSRSVRLKRPIHSQLNRAILLCDVITDGKIWVNCVVLTGSSEGLRTVLSSRLSHRELLSSVREYHSFLSLPADTTMASSQGKTVSSNSFSRWSSLDIFLFKCHFLLNILRFLFLFSDNIMADVASKQQTTALFLSAIVTRTRGHTELTKKNDKPDGKLVLCQRTFNSVFRAVFFTQLNCTI